MHDWADPKGAAQVWFKRRVPHSGNVHGGSVHAGSVHGCGNGGKLGCGSDAIIACSAGGGVLPAAPSELFNAVLSTKPLHPLPGFKPEVNCTPQGEPAGPSYTRLPHFSVAPWPVDETRAHLHSEYFVPRDNAREAIEAMRGMAEVTQRTQPHTVHCSAALHGYYSTLMSETASLPPSRTLSHSAPLVLVVPSYTPLRATTHTHIREQVLQPVLVVCELRTVGADEVRQSFLAHIERRSHHGT